MILENETLKVELDAKRPIVERYLHKPTGQVFDGRGVNLDISTLHQNGRGPAPDYTLSGDTLWLKLEAGVPVKITKK